MLLASFGAQARGGGHVTTFDPNLFGGGWWCVRTAASGTCGGATSGFQNLACDGVTNELTAWKSFIAAAQAQNPTLVKLYFPPGSKCKIIDDGTVGLVDGIKNVIMWGYGAEINSVPFGAIQAIFQDNVHHALVATVSAGSTTVTVTDGNVGRLTIGHWVMVGGLYLQAGGYPPNLGFFEYHTITNIVGNVVTLDTPLANGYKSTWPVDPTDIPTIGPATIYDLNQVWDTNAQIFGLTNSQSPGQIGLGGRNVSYTDVTIMGNGSPSSSMSWFCFFCTFDGKDVSHRSSEYDKLLSSTYFYRLSAPLGMDIFSQNANSTFYASFIPSLNGFTTNTTIAGGSIIGNANFGSGGFGHAATSLTLQDSTVSSFFCGANAIPVGTLTYSNTLNGTFSVPNGSNGSAIAWAVPGQTYFFGTLSPIVNLGSSFTITDITQDASNTNIVTNLPATLPSLGQTHYIAQPVTTLTATNMTGTSTPTNATGAWCHL